MKSSKEKSLPVVVFGRDEFIARLVNTDLRNSLRHTKAPHGITSTGNASRGNQVGGPVSSVALPPSGSTCRQMRRGDGSDILRWELRCALPAIGYDYGNP